MNNWISVNDELPKHEQFAVLVTRTKTKAELEKDREVFPIIFGALTDDGEWYDFNDGKIIDSEKWIITHWMDLPEPATPMKIVE